MIKLTDRQSRYLDNIIDKVSLNNKSKLGQLTFINLDAYDLDESPKEFVDFVKQSKKMGIHDALEYDLINIMDDEQSAIYPLDPQALEVLTDTSVFGVDDETAKTVDNLIEELINAGIPSGKIDTYFFNTDNEPVEK